MTNKERYSKYLKSPEWKELRLKALKKTPYCVLCSKIDNLQVHHRKYPEVFGEEPVEWLTVLCGRCHKAFHKNKKPTYKKKGKNKPKKIHPFDSDGVFNNLRKERIKKHDAMVERFNEENKVKPKTILRKKP